MLDLTRNFPGLGFRVGINPKLPKLSFSTPKPEPSSRTGAETSTRFHPFRGLPAASPHNQAVGLLVLRAWGLGALGFFLRVWAVGFTRLGLGLCGFPGFSALGLGVAGRGLKTLEWRKKPRSCSRARNSGLVVRCRSDCRIEENKATAQGSSNLTGPKH